MKLEVKCQCVGTPSEVMTAIHQSTEEEKAKIVADLEHFERKYDKVFFNQQGAIENWMATMNKSRMDSFAD